MYSEIPLQYPAHFFSTCITLQEAVGKQVVLPKILLKKGDTFSVAYTGFSG